MSTWYEYSFKQIINRKHLVVTLKGHSYENVCQIITLNYR
jgi:hypothetical protein